MLSERQTPGFKSPWGQQIGSTGKLVTDEEADEPVFIDKMPWIGDGGDRVGHVTILCNVLECRFYLLYCLMPYQVSVCTADQPPMLMLLSEWLVTL